MNNTYYAVFFSKGKDKEKMVAFSKLPLMFKKEEDAQAECEMVKCFHPKKSAKVKKVKLTIIE